MSLFTLLLAPLPPSRKGRQSTFLKADLEPRSSSVPPGCTWQPRPRREVWVRMGLRGSGQAAGSESATRRGAALKGAGPSSRSTLALVPLHAWARSAGSQERRSDADPGCAERCPQERRGPPASPGEPAAPGRRAPGNSNTKRKGNQPALTCKQGFHLEEPPDRPPDTLGPRSACNQSTCPPQGPPGRDPSWWRLQLRAPQPPASGERKPAGRRVPSAGAREPCLPV